MILTPENDPMGNAIADFYYKKAADRLIVDSSITEDEEIGVDYLFRDFESMPQIEKVALEKCNGKVLDVGAAAGCHALYLQNKSIEVTAVDISELSVEVLKKRGLKTAECIDFFDVNEKFDTLLFLMNGVGIAGNMDGLYRLLQKCKDLLLPGGQVLLDSSDIVYMFEDDEGYSEKMEGYYGELKYQMKYKDIKGEEFDWLFIDFNLLSQKAKEAGFDCELLVEGEHFDYLAQLTMMK